MKLFVYGTLKRGYYNHKSLMKGAKYLGDAKLDGYCIFNLGSYPGIMPKPGFFVWGELFEITDDMLDPLDRLEGHPTLYKRTAVSIGNMGDAWVYVYQNKHGFSRPIIETGVWEGGKQ